MSERWKWISGIIGSLILIFVAMKIVDRRNKGRVGSFKKSGEASSSSSESKSKNQFSEINSKSSSKEANSMNGKDGRQLASSAGNSANRRKEGEGETAWNSLERRLREWDPKAQWTVRRENERLVRAVSGGLIPSKGVDERSVQDFLDELGDSLGVSTKELAPPSRRTFDVENIFESKQMVQGYEVDGAFVKIFSRASDGAIYYLASEMKIVNHPLIRKDLDLNAARNLISPLFSGKKFEIEGNEAVQGANPRIYVKDDTYSELVWVFIVKVTTPTYDRRMLYIGAQSGQVLLNQSLLMH